MFIVKKKDIPENCDEDLELLEHLLQQQLVETEPDIVAELQTLIDNICKR